MNAVGRSLLVAVLALSVPRASAAAPFVLDFEDLSDLEIVTTQFPGLTFSNTIALTAGASLNDAEFPPRSGLTVVSDNTGPMRIDFLAPVDGFGGFFTYFTPIVLTAFNASNAVIGSVNSAFNSNLAISGEAGSAPNELLQLLVGHIAYVTITGDPAGDSFTLDDATITPAEAPAPIPEPGTIIFVTTGLAVLAARRRRPTVA